MFSLRPFDLALWQDQLNLSSTSVFPDLIVRKRQRQLLSPHGLLRGSASLFYEILASRPDLWAGPAGDGWIIGDMHLENVGAYHNDNHEVTFDLNDFDDAAQGPWRLDVLRLATSILLASRCAGAMGPSALPLLDALFSSYVPVACAGGTPPAAPQPPDSISKLLDKVRKRTMQTFLDERSTIHKGERTFLRGERYRDLAPDITAAVPQLLKIYVEALGDRAPNHAHKWEVVDAVHRIAGTGSLGCLRLAVLVRNHAGEDRILDFKQEHPSSVSRLAPDANSLAPAQRVTTAAKAMLESPPLLLAALPQNLLGSFIARKLRPQEDKLDLSRMDPAKELLPLVRTVGDLLARAHLRGASNRPHSPWSDAEVETLRKNAIELAGIFEATYLAYSHLFAKDAEPAPK